MYPCDPISLKYMKIRGEASYYYAEIKEFVKEFCLLTGCRLHCDVFHFTNLTRDFLFQVILNYV